MTIEYSEIEDAFSFVSSGGLGENEAYLSLSEGKIYWHSEYGDFEELPEDVENENYLYIPHKNELGLGKSLAIAFGHEYLSKELAEIHSIFSRRGAYSGFKELLVSKNLLEKWYSFESSATEKAIRQWCSENGVKIKG